MESDSPFINSVKVPFNYVHYLALQMIDMHNYTLIRKTVSQEHPDYSSDYLDAGILYLKRYYAIHILDPLNPPAMSRPVDPFWHTHVLYSEDYVNFCNKVFGEYLHHIPLLFEDKMAVAFVRDMYIHTRKRHAEIFWEPDDTFIPTDPGRGGCCSPSGALGLAKYVDSAIFKEDPLITIAPSP
jgi:hypothetical protein